MQLLPTPLSLLALAGLLLPQAPPVADPPDPRTGYDVETYRLDLRVQPDTKTLSGTVAVEALVVRDGLDEIVLDLKPALEVARVALLAGPLDADSSLSGNAVAFTRDGALLFCPLGSPAKAGARVRLAITYSGHPKSRDSFSGFHWAKTKDGQPWISTSCQGEGSASWWPSKDSFFHPEDKPARVFENYTVPKGLYAVGNGRLTGRADGPDSTETFRWAHGYPLETYSVTLNVAPYVVVEQALRLDGIEEPVPFVYYVLPENAEKAALQFQDVPGMLEAFSRAFGPYPFPKSKYALVETSFWGMEHSTAVAYGSSYPAWIAKHGGKDRYKARNALFDYILVHESAHEWWGNGVSASAWGDFWIHEGFATYAEAVYLEHTRGPAVAQTHMDAWRKSIGPRARVYRGDDVDSGEAYNQSIYSKGAWVLHTLRQFVDDDEVFWRAVRAFNLEHRYGNAGTQDFRAILERETKGDWKRFFDEWVYGEGFPKLTGAVDVRGRVIHIDVENRASAGGEFHVPLDILATSNGVERRERVWLEPGENHLEIRGDQPFDTARIRGLERILCDAPPALRGK